MKNAMKLNNCCHRIALFLTLMSHKTVQRVVLFVLGILILMDGRRIRMKTTTCYVS
jgi:hypothetical protein